MHYHLPFHPTISLAICFEYLMHNESFIWQTVQSLFQKQKSQQQTSPSKTTTKLILFQIVNFRRQHPLTKAKHGFVYSK